MSPTEPWRNPRPAPNLDVVRHRVPTKDMIAAWLRSWWPALVWAVVIFIFSTDGFSLEHTGRFIEPVLRWFFPSAPTERIHLLHHLIRKAAHFFEYFLRVHLPCYASLAPWLALELGLRRLVDCRHLFGPR